MFCGMPTDLNHAYLWKRRTLRYAIINFYPNVGQTKTYEQILSAFETLKMHAG